jgi:phosphate-selective porin OprO/OprP
MPDFGQNNSQIQDAYIELNILRAAKPRVGKFKTPIGLEVLKSDRELVFAERSMASDLVPLRELGAQIAGSILSDTATYAVGYFNGALDGISRPMPTPMPTPITRAPIVLNPQSNLRRHTHEIQN